MFSIYPDGGIGERGVEGRGWIDHVHWFAVPGLLEDLGRHVAGRAARGGQHVELLLVHDAREAEVCNEEIGVVFRRAEE